MLNQARSRAASRLPAPCHVAGRICAGYSTDLRAAGSHDQIARRGSRLSDAGTVLLPCDAAGTSASAMEIASAPTPAGSVACASAAVDDARVVPWSDVPRVARRSAGGSSNDGLTACSNAAAAALALTLNPLPGSQHTQTTSSPPLLYIPPPQRHHRNSALHSALSPALCLSALHAPRPACTPSQSPADTWRASLPFHAAAAASGKAYGRGHVQVRAQQLSLAAHHSVHTAHPSPDLILVAECAYVVHSPTLSATPLAPHTSQCALHTSAGLVPQLVSSPPSLPRYLQQLVGAYHSAAATDGSQAVSKFEEVSRPLLLFRASAIAAAAAAAAAAAVAAAAAASAA
ncbi:unnamed protein product [Closterium sp. NIES-54]